MITPQPRRRTGQTGWAIFACVLVITAIVFAGQAMLKPDTADDALRRGHYDVALTHLLDASEQGDPGAQVQIGNLYALGLGVERDTRAAATWYQKAAFAGSAQARVNMGHLSNHAFALDGSRPGADIRRPESMMAYAWFNLARNQGHTQAQLYMSELLHDGHMTYHVVNQIRREYATIDAFRRLDLPK